MDADKAKWIDHLATTNLECDEWIITRRSKMSSSKQVLIKLLNKAVQQGKLQIFVGKGSIRRKRLFFGGYIKTPDEHANSPP